MSKRDQIRRNVQQALNHARPSGTGWWRANCPECLARTGKVDHKQAMSINVRSGVFWCWKCQLSGSIKPGAQYTPVDDAGPNENDMSAPDGFTALASSDGMRSISLEPAREYAEKRCPQPLWRETGIGACATGNYAGRVIIPVLAEDNETWLGWVGRTWYPSDKAYTYPKGMARGAVLYNGKALHEPTDEPVLVVEGVFDAIHLWPNGVALLGKASEEQMEALAATKRPVAICLDGDAWLESYAMTHRLRLHGKLDAGYVRLPPKLDPDEVERSWLDSEVAACLTR